MMTDLHKLTPAFYVGLEPVKHRCCHSEFESKTIEEQPVVDCVEGCGQVEADQHSDLLHVCRRKNSVNDL